jgi:hypothetical protein
MIKMKKYNTKIELFTEKTGDIIRVIRFRNSIAFEEFLKGFKAGRYPGYSWRYKDIRKKQENNE